MKESEKKKKKKEEIGRRVKRKQVNNVCKERQGAKKNHGARGKVNWMMI